MAHQGSVTVQGVIELLNVRRWHEAADAAALLLQSAPGRPELMQLLAAALDGAGRQHEAAAIYERLVAAAPQNPHVWLNYGHVLRMIGRLNEAVQAYRRVLAIAPGTGEAYWSLSDVKTFCFEPSDTKRLRDLLQRPLDRMNGAYVLYALAKALDQEGAYAEAFECFRRGADLMKSGGDETASLSAFVQRAEDVFTADFFASRASFGAQSADPIFVVGLPRSGTTLVEQILASHSEVEGTMELPHLGELAHALGGPLGANHVDVLERAPGDAFAALGNTYLEQTRPWRQSKRRFFIDKMPQNSWHTGLIQLALPKAKIIDVRRHPLACGWSCYTQLFPQSLGFTYDLGAIGRYYVAYVRLAKHYDTVLPGRVHRVVYEDLVADPETQIRALLDYCALPHEPGCFAPHRTERVVRSVSAEQVREPINAKGLTRWKTYEPYLEELKAALGPTLRCYPAAP